MLVTLKVKDLIFLKKNPTTPVIKKEGLNPINSASFSVPVPSQNLEPKVIMIFW
jgi:hypothetical protein